MKRIAIAAFALALAGALAGCGDDDPKSDPASAPAPTPSASPSSDPTWDDEFTPEQMKRYEAARKVWLEFWDFYTDITSKGVDNPGVLRGFKKYTIAPLSERSQFLDTYVRGGARIEVPPEVLWTSATKIRRNTVDLSYCLDNTDVRITVDGKKVPQEKPYLVERNVRMRHTAKGWLMDHDMNGQEIEKCSRTAP